MKDGKEQRLGARFADALVYAADVHREQVRKGTQIPYVGHLLGVTSIVIDAGGDEDEAIAAVLHDAAEDQGGLTRLNEIRERFGDRVAEIVQGCSDPLAEAGKDDTKTYDQKKAAYLEHLRKCGNESVYLISVGDKLHNARAMLLDFRIQRHELWNRFNKDAGREKILRNYDNLVAAYEAGPPDRRRVGLVHELKATLETLRAESEASV